MRKFSLLKVNAKALKALLAMLVVGILPSCAMLMGIVQSVEAQSSSASLDGTWVRADNVEVITVSGNGGVFSRYNPTSTAGRDAVNKGYIKVGDQAWRNLRSTGNLTWSGQFLAYTFNTSNRNVAIGTQWDNMTLTMSADGRTLTMSGVLSGVAAAAFTDTYTRQTEAAAPNTTTYRVGDRGPGGGIIFYHNPAGFTVEMPNSRDNYTAYYLEVAPADAGQAQWGASGTAISGVTTATSTQVQQQNKIGNGRKDTALIVAELQGKETGRAAQIASAYTNNGMRDWFLPSLGEMKELYNERNLAGINITGDRYWSSTQYGNSQSWYISANNGNIIMFGKGASLYVRPIRAF